MNAPSLNLNLPKFENLRNRVFSIIHTMPEALTHPCVIALLMFTASFVGLLIYKSFYALQSDIVLVLISPLVFLFGITLMVTEGKRTVGMWIAAVLISVCTLLIYIFGVFSFNHWWQKTDQRVYTIDNQAVIDDAPHWIIPFKHSIQTIPFTFDVKDHPVIGTTSDGVQISAKIGIQLRRTDNPKNWAVISNINPSLEETAAKLFKDCCASIDSKKILSMSALGLELQTTGSEKLKNALPAAVQCNGEVRIWDIHAYYKD